MLKIIEGTLVIAAVLFPAFLLTASVVSLFGEAQFHEDVHWLWFALVSWVIGVASSEYAQKERGK